MNEKAKIGDRTLLEQRQVETIKKLREALKSTPCAPMGQVGEVTCSFIGCLRCETLKETE